MGLPFGLGGLLFNCKNGVHEVSTFKRGRREGRHTVTLELFPSVVLLAEVVHGHLDAPFAPLDEERRVKGCRPGPAGDVGLSVGHGGWLGMRSKRAVRITAQQWGRRARVGACLARRRGANARGEPVIYSMR